MTSTVPSGRQRANAVIGIVAGIVLVTLTIVTAFQNDMDGTAWAGAVVAVVVGVTCAAVGIVRLRRPTA